MCIILLYDHILTDFLPYHHDLTVKKPKRVRYKETTCNGNCTVSPGIFQWILQFKKKMEKKIRLIWKYLNICPFAHVCKNNPLYLPVAAIWMCDCKRITTKARDREKKIRNHWILLYITNVIFDLNIFHFGITFWKWMVGPCV